MEIQILQTSVTDWQGEALAIGITEEQLTLTPELTQLDQKLSGAISELISQEEFDAKANSVVATRLSNSTPIRKLILVGLGKQEELEADHLRRAAATITRTASAQKIKTLGVSLPDLGATGAIAEGLILAAHQDNRFKSDSKDKNSSLTTVQLLGQNGNQDTIIKAEKICSGVILARELVAAPANVVTPGFMADIADKLAQEYGLSLEILETEDCERLGMGAFLGVAKASELPPKFIHLTYKPSGKPRKRLAIVGKGVTFDSGGLNIKGVGSGIETMKMDMGGAAATLGAAKAIAQLQPDVEVHFISAVAENMISGRALHPGDILTASNGKTIEVNNTDAEGRLTLADALVFTEKLELDAIVDLATLTGACVVALGDNIAGLWSNDPNLATEIKQASTQSGEKFWEMPLEDKYLEGLKSPIADLKNTGPRGGGAITAALFLKEFVEKTPWAHLDIAGPVWADKQNGVNNEGATGFPVRTLVNWVLG